LVVAALAGRPAKAVTTNVTVGSDGFSRQTR
jgi:hypothetical protein